MPDRLDDEAERQRDPECDAEPDPRVVLERLPAEIAEQRSVRGPEEAGDRVVDDEAPPGERRDVPGGEGHGDAPTGDEPRDEDDVGAALVEHVLGPLQTALRLLTGEPALDRALSDERADPVPEFVSQGLAAPTEKNDGREVEVTRGCEIAADDGDG